MSCTDNPDERTPETIDGEASRESDDTTKPIEGEVEVHEPTPPTSRRIPLSNLREVRLELAYVYRQMDSGEIKSQDGTRRAYVLKTIHDIIVSAELERRLSELEAQQGIGDQNGRPRLPGTMRTVN